ncbi:uncharacterized protein LOC144141747 [Haemaphysalis longicornis]
MSTGVNGSPTLSVPSKRSPVGPFTVDVAPLQEECEKHTPSERSNMMRSFCLQARILRICGALFIKDMFAKPPRSPKVVWLHWYTLYAAACFTFFLWFETDVVTRHAIELSDTNRFFTKSLLVLLHVVILIKASGNFVSMIVGCKKMIEFLEKADTFEKESGVPTCTCCGQKRYFWADIRGVAIFAVYFTSYTVALFHQEQKVDEDGLLGDRDIVNRVCGFFAGILFYTYDSVNFIKLRTSAQVIEGYIAFLKKTIDECVGHKVTGCEMEAAKKVQTVRLHLCTVLDLKNAINSIWQKSVVVSSVGLLLVTCISLYTIITEGLVRTELWIAMGYSAFTFYQFLELARVSQSLCNSYQAIKDSCRKTPTMDSTAAYSHQVQYLHNTINSDDISLNGSGFFKVNLPLLVSMAGSIITYTVILVQTSPDLSESTPTCHSATATTLPGISP